MEMVFVLGDITFREWRLAANDPGLLGWGTTLLYFIAAGLAIRAWKGEDRIDDADRVRRRKFWFIAAMAVILLGVNKQLDLHHLLKEILAEIVDRAGWDDSKHTLRKTLVVLLGLLILAGAAWTLWSLRCHLRRYWFPLASLAVLALFMLIRAASFSGKLRWFNTNNALHAHLLLEVLPLLCFGASAYLCRPLRRSMRPATT